MDSEIKLAPATDRVIDPSKNQSNLKSAAFSILGPTTSQIYQDSKFPSQTMNSGKYHGNDSSYMHLNNNTTATSGGVMNDEYSDFIRETNSNGKSFAKNYKSP